MERGSGGQRERGSEQARERGREGGSEEERERAQLLVDAEAYQAKEARGRDTLPRVSASCGRLSPCPGSLSGLCGTVTGTRPLNLTFPSHLKWNKQREVGKAGGQEATNGGRN
jgi:hypothetical protein